MECSIMTTRAFTLLILLAGASFASAEPLDITNAKSNEAATALVARYFEATGLEVADKRESFFVLKSGGLVMRIAPLATTDLGSRLNAYITYGGGSPDNLKSEKLMSLLNTINAKYNYVTSYVDKDGSLSFRYVLVFDKKLEAKTINLWLKHIELQTNAIRNEFGDQLRTFLTRKTDK
jgi:hypothetical protein